MGSMMHQYEDGGLETSTLDDQYCLFNTCYLINQLVEYKFVRKITYYELAPQVIKELNASTNEIKMWLISQNCDVLDLLENPTEEMKRLHRLKWEV